MKMTYELRREINRACRLEVAGPNAFVECGLRGEHWLPNMLNWRWDDDDLQDLLAVRAMYEIDDCPEHPGCAALDCYVTTGRGNDRELECNVYVAIKDGHVVAATSDDLESDNIIREALGINTCQKIV